MADSAVEIRVEDGFRFASKRSFRLRVKVSRIMLLLFPLELRTCLFLAVQTKVHLAA